MVPEKAEGDLWKVKSSEDMDGDLQRGRHPERYFS